MHSHSILKILAFFINVIIAFYSAKGCLNPIPLGLSNGYINNYQITASSYHEIGNFKYLPSQARLGISNCWCGNFAGKGNWIDEWIQVDFNKPVVITAIATQGDPNQLMNFVKNFSLQFSDDGKTFYYMNDTSGKRKEFIGNTDNTEIKFNWLTKTSSTRFVRLRATSLNNAYDGAVCLRMEFYGCRAGKDDPKYGTSLFSLGIENGKINDAAITASSEIIGKEAKFARLNIPSGWCALSNSDQWLQVDLGRVLSITAIAAQGFGAESSFDVVKTFQVSHSVTSDALTFKKVEDFPGRAILFSSDAKTNQDPFLAILPKAVTARYVRIIPKSKGTKSANFCMRMEIFGHNQKCYKSITELPGNTLSSSSVKAGTSHENAFIFSANSWCADVNDANQFIKMQFRVPIEVSGIAIQGDAQNSNWIKSFKVKYKPPCGTETELATVFDGNSDAHTVIRHWFSSIIETEHLIILPKTWNNNICLRFQILGCTNANLKRVPLGMRNGFLSTNQTSVSSIFSDDIKFGAGQARLGMHTRWCGKKIGANSKDDYHQVDFGRLIILTGIATQGDPTYTSGNNYVKKFYLETANSTSIFSPIMQCTATQIFLGNSDQTNIKYNYFSSGIVARFVRFHATELARNDNNRHACLRLDYYGMELDGFTAAASKGLFPLGMENNLIKDAQLTASIGYNSNPAKNGRLNNAGGWCSGTTNDGWLKISFPHSVTITAVALQGHGGSNSPDRTYKYYFQYLDSTTWKNVKDLSSTDKLFIGNKMTSVDPVMDFLPIPITGTKFRINPYVLGDGSTVYCLRAEIYGYHTVCSDDLTNSEDVLITGSSYESKSNAQASHINSPITWCATSSDSSPYLLVNLGSRKMISGFGVQGDSNGDNWATEVKISHGNEQCCMAEMTSVFKTNVDRNRAVYHWFDSLIEAQFFKIKLNARVGKACMRIKVFGCDLVHGRTPLGMSNGFIKNSQISVTSRFHPGGNNDKRWMGFTGRLEVTDNRWCSAQPLNYQDYLQVDFERNVTITGVATQGDDNFAGNYVKKYYLQVSFDGNVFTSVTDLFGKKKIFTGNIDHNNIVYNWLPVPTKARYVRFRASDVSGTHICARLEYYGRADDKATGKSLFALGMESGVIVDSQLSSSGNGQLTSDPNNPPKNARFRHVNMGWCAPNGDNNQWLQIDFKQRMVITAVATQGHGGGGDLKEATYRYYLMYGNTSSSSFEFVGNASTNKMLFTGNNLFKNVPVMNVLPVPVTTQFLRINPITKGDGSTLRCLRTEIYGYHPECSDDLTNIKGTFISASSSKTGTFPYRAKVYNQHAWCPSSTSLNEYIQVDLGHVHRITGVGIQGDSENDFWPTKFKINLGKRINCLKEMQNEYTANKNRNGVTRHWFSGRIFARFLKFRVTSFNGAGPVCLRIQVLGCREIIRDSQKNGRTPLGMSNGFVRNNQITVTSRYGGPTDKRWIGFTGRLEVTDNRWCSAQPLNFQDYLQVDFERNVTVTGVATQGDDNHLSNYVKKYYLQVSFDGNVFKNITDLSCDTQILTGNTDNNGIVYNWLQVPTKARYVRFRASDVSGTHICARLEYYGTDDDKVAEKSLYALGMESGVIADSQLTSSGNGQLTSGANNPPKNARFRNGNIGWCAPNGDNNQWLQIDFKQRMVITAVATQGHGGGGVLKETTYKYYLMYGNTSSSSFEFVGNASTNKMLFTGNNLFKNVPVMNVLPVPVTTQFLRINPITKGEGATFRCLRTEIYGYQPVCYDDLTRNSIKTASTNLISNPPRNVFVNSANTWCAESSDTTGHIDVILPSPRVITAIGIQGDFNNDYWIKTFKFSHALDAANFKELSKTFIGNKDRNSVVRHWLLPPVVAKYIRIKADTFSNKVCARIQVIGCSKDYDVVNNFSATVINMRTINITWTRIHSSSNFTVQYREIGATTWTNVINVSKSHLILVNIAKYKEHEVRLKSVKGILDLQDTVTGGLNFLGSQKFVLIKRPITIPRSVSIHNVATTSFNVTWKKLTQDQILDWDIQGLSIYVTCTGDQKTKSCNTFVQRMYNITSLELNTTSISNLASWTNYTIKVQVYNVERKGKYSPAITVVTAPQAPVVAPKILTISGKKTTVEIAIEPYPNEKSDGKLLGVYLFYRCIQTDRTRDCVELNWKSITHIDPGKTSFSITGLMTWTLYEVKMQVFNTAGTSPSVLKNATTEETEPSTAPSKVTALIMNSTYIRVSWSSLTKNDTNGIITHFILKIAKPGSSENKSITVFTNAYNVTGLKPFTNYSIQVAAVNNAGTGPYSKVIIRQTPEAAPSQAPSIQNITATKFSATIKIKNIKKDYENGVILGYKLSYRCIESSMTRNCLTNSSVLVDFVGSVKADFSITKLMSWTKYGLKIAVYNKAGISPYSTEEKFTTSEEAPRRPPKSVSVKTISSRSIILEWKSLDWNDTNGIIISYSIEIKSVHGEEKINVSIKQQHYTFKGLTPYTNYTIRIAAVNKMGFGPYSDYLTQQTDEEAPSMAPNIIRIDTSKDGAEVYIQNINKTSANGKLIGYYLSYRCISDANKRDCPEPVKAANVTFHDYPKTLISISNLFSWMKYAMTIQVYNSAGSSKPSSEIIIATKEDNPSMPPSNISIEVTGSTSLKIQWQALFKNDTNGVIIGYNVSVFFTRKGATFSMSTFTNALNLSLDKLFPYTKYTVKIAAKNSAGFGRFSVGEQARTLQDAPSSPTNVKTTPIGTTMIHVEWSKPVDANGIITKYEFQYCLKNGNCTTMDISANITEKLMKDLETHVDYTFKVRAFTIKPGNWSTIITQKTEEGIPTMPLELTITNRQKTSFKLSWKKPIKPKGVIRYYKIKVSGKKAYNASFSHIFEIQKNCSSNCNWHTLENLIPSTEYTCEVAVATSVGLGPYSLKVSAETLISEPPKPFYTVLSKLQDGGTERNFTVFPVTNLNGPVIAYQVIVEIISTGSSMPMTSFPQLRSKTEAEEQGIKYYLAAEKDVNKTPFQIRLRPGISYVEAFDAGLDTPGNYYLHFRAVSQAYKRPKAKRIYGGNSFYHLKREFLKKLPEPKQEDVGSSTIKVKLTTTLPKGFVPLYYYIVAVEVVSGTKPKDPSSFKQEDLKKYNSATYQPGAPYIAAALTSTEFNKITHFTLGDGRTSKVVKTRRKRQARAVTEEYLNTALKAEKLYSIFVRAVSATSSYYSTPWTSEIKTKPAPPPTKKKTSQNPAIAAGVSVSIIIVLAAVGLTVFFKRRRNSDKSSQSTDNLNSFEEQEMNVKNPRAVAKPEEVVLTTDVDGLPSEPIDLKISPSQKFPLFAAKDIVQIVKRKSAMEDAGFKEEFQSLPQGKLFTWNVGGKSDNKPKNRFANIIAYDYSRVKLRNSQDESDYINANFIVDYQGRGRYIASQAPIPKTISDFWTMIWEQEVPAIVMLTRCVEGNKRKSEEYWPTSGSEHYGNITVSFLGAEEYPEYILSTFEMQKGDVIRTCKHFHYMTWPDHGVPLYPTSLLSFRRRLRQALPYDTQNRKPILIHCSAGVGRTGAFIAVDTLIHLIHKQRIVDVCSYVSLLRLQRPEMVQRATQYKFIYDCLLEAAICGVTEISAQEFRQRFNNLSNKDPKTGKDGFHREFTCLSFVAIDIEEQEFSSAKQSCIAHKNRDPTVLPRNTMRVFLPALEFTEGCNYINAVFVDGQQQDQFIATQAPLECTIGDFWRMVIDRGSSTVVSLVDHNEAFPRYYPENKQAKYGEGQLTISLQSSEKIAQDITLRRFVGTDDMYNRTSSEIHHFSLNFWPEHSVPESVISLIKVIDEVEKTQRQFGGGPIIVHCSNGAGRTGCFIAAYIILERLKSEQMLDVFQVVRRIRKTRPKFVENREQYKLLYEVVNTYLAQFSTYSNF